MRIQCMQCMHASTRSQTLLFTHTNPWSGGVFLNDDPSSQICMDQKGKDRAIRKSPSHCFARFCFCFCFCFRGTTPTHFGVKKISNRKRSNCDPRTRTRTGWMLPTVPLITVSHPHGKKNERRAGQFIYLLMIGHMVIHVYY